MNPLRLPKGVGVAGGMLLASVAHAQTASLAHFESKVRPLFQARCIACHGATVQQAGLRLDRPVSPALAQKVRDAVRYDGKLKMPPSGKLPEHELAALTQWVNDGAPYPTSPIIGGQGAGGVLWSLRPVRRSALPKVRQAAWVRNPVDAFVLASLEKKGQKPAPQANKRTLIRRVTFDLTGLPPTPEEVAAFLADTRPNAYALLIERLLASPRYGEKWGRLWLDVARYADTAGENSDHPLPHAWRYRNWVIEAFNKNLPYDQFIRQQIAGDLDRNPVPTGYLALARRFGHDIDQDIHLTYEDVIDTLGKSVLGLTVGCARCHDHKFDPIPQRDYYRLYGIFESTRLSFPGCEPKQQPHDLVPIPTPGKHTPPVLLSQGEIPDGGSAPFSARVAVQQGDVLLLLVTPQKSHGADTTRLELTLTEQGGTHRWSLADLLDTFPDARVPGIWSFWDAQNGLLPLKERLDSINGQSALRGWRNGDTPSVLVNRAAQPVTVWTTLPPRSFFVHPGPAGPVAVAWHAPITATIELAGTISDAHPGGPDGVGWRLEHLPGPEPLAALQPTLLAYAVAEGTPHDTRLHQRGDPAQPGALTPRGFLAVLGGQSVQDPRQSGRRELAQWLTDPKNPLTPRVWVNRLWQGHFGRGLVATPNDFGTRGTLPTHPELLDWLASELLRTGWDTKALHRLILTSATYQQVANPLLPRRRLTAEELRDSLLALSGELDLAPAEAHPFPPESTWSFTQHTPFAAEYETNKRSVYVLQKRNRRTRFFSLFDGADPNASTPVRDNTTVPTQALFFLNDPFVHQRAKAFAQRTTAAAPELSARVRTAWLLLYGRSPAPAELADALAFVKTYPQPDTGWEAYARILFASNEFLYVD